jgi:fermentation-respiration switch protein FrsA (DUF1100 family)
MIARLLNRCKIGVLCVCGCLLLTILVTACQRTMIYHPVRYGTGTLDSAALEHGLKPWLNKNGEKIGWQRSAAAAATAQVLIVHGNAGSALDRADFVRGLQCAEPINIFILEYPGYGDRTGKPSQTSLLQAATEAFELLTNSGSIYVVGESLGTGVAAYLAGTFPEGVSGLLLFCPFNNLTEVARYHTMRLLPVNLMLRDRFPSDQWLQSYGGPVGILLAVEDRVVPARFGRRLYDGYRGPKKLWEIPGAGHNDVFVRPEDWWREVFDFWKRSSTLGH